MKPTTVLLPTKEDTEVIDQIADQLTPGDELLVICDTEKDPVASEIENDENVSVIVAGEPENCSGKANAIAAGMENAENERLVWTDGDFEHPDDWLESLREEYDGEGAVSELPFFVGKSHFSRLVEPLYAAAMFVAYLKNAAWGGSVIFDRSELDEDKFLEELRSSLADDALLSKNLEVKTLRRTRRVNISNNVKESVERIVRFTQTSKHYAPKLTYAATAASPIVAALLLLNPVIGISVTTLAAAGIYSFFDRERLTFMLTYLALMVAPMLLMYGLVRNVFSWHGREYWYKDKMDVEIV